MAPALLSTLAANTNGGCDPTHPASYPSPAPATLQFDFAAPCSPADMHAALQEAKRTKRRVGRPKGSKNLPKGPQALLPARRARKARQTPPTAIAAVLLNEASTITTAATEHEPAAPFGEEAPSPAFAPPVLPPVDLPAGWIYQGPAESEPVTAAPISFSTTGSTPSEDWLLGLPMSSAFRDMAEETAIYGDGWLDCPVIGTAFDPHMGCWER